MPTSVPSILWDGQKLCSSSQLATNVKSVNAPVNAFKGKAEPSDVRFALLGFSSLLDLSSWSLTSLGTLWCLQIYSLKICYLAYLRCAFLEAYLPHCCWEQKINVFDFKGLSQTLVHFPLLYQPFGVRRMKKHCPRFTIQQLRMRKGKWSS